VNEAFVNRYLQGGSAIGRRLRLGGRDTEPWTTIVGVAADFRNNGPMQPVRPEIYTPVRQQTDWNQLFLLARGERDAAALLPTVREAVRALDPEQPIYAVQPLSDAVAASTFQPRVAAALLSIFAAIALTLAAVGIFGVLSYVVSARTQEIGVRIAIGAEPRDVRWLVMRQILKMLAVGTAIGLAVVLASGRAVQRLLFGVSPADPAAIAAAAALLAAVALVAAWVPARRASRVDPIAALRAD
jgi:predicted lysophospholipase L1 biosynthesis ABC-type transport system permease subunit